MRRRQWVALGGEVTPLALMVACSLVLGTVPALSQAKVKQQQSSRAQWEAVKRRDQGYWQKRQSSVRVELKATQTRRGTLQFGSAAWHATGEVQRALERESAWARGAGGYRTLEERSRWLQEALRARQTVLGAQVKQAEALQARTEFGSRTWHALEAELAALKAERSACAGYRAPQAGGTDEREEREFWRRRQETLRAQIRTAEELKREAPFGSAQWQTANDLLNALQHEEAALK